KADSNDKTTVVSLALLVLSGSWLGWYVLLSAGWLRYLFPPTFVGSIFVATMMRGLTGQFSLSATVRRAGHALKHFKRDGVGALVAVILIAIAVPLTVNMLHWSFTAGADTSAFETGAFLNEQTGPNALIESW